MQNTITDEGKQLQESFPPIQTFKTKGTSFISCCSFLSTQNDDM